MKRKYQIKKNLKQSKIELIGYFILAALLTFSYEKSRQLMINDKFRAKY